MLILAERELSDLGAVAAATAATASVIGSAPLESRPSPRIPLFTVDVSAAAAAVVVALSLCFTRFFNSCASVALLMTGSVLPY